MKKLSLRIIQALFLIAFLILALDYSGLVAKEKRYERYANEPEDVDIIAARSEYNKSLLSNSEPIRISFKQQWIPEDADHVIDIHQEIRKVGDTQVTVDKAYLIGNDVCMAVALEHSTVIRRGAFLYNYIIDSDGNQHGITPSVTFFHHNQQITLEEYGYGYGQGGSVTVTIPLSVLKQYNYSIDVEFDGYVLYGYEYTGD